MPMNNNNILWNARSLLGIPPNDGVQTHGRFYHYTKV